MVAILTLFLLTPLAGLPTPRPQSPADGAELRVLPREVSLEWSPVERGETYTLEIDMWQYCEHDKWCSEVSADRTMVYRDLKATKFPFEALGFDRRVRWRVWATAGFLTSEKSVWRTFAFQTVGLPQQPAAPVQVSPVEGASVREGIYEWQPVTGADSYTIEIDYYDADNCMRGRWCSELAQSTIVANLKDTHYSAKFTGRNQARWRVWAVAGDRKTLKSAWRMFTYAGPGFSLTNDSSAYVAGNGVTPPQLIFSPSPSFTEAARKAHYRGTCRLKVIVEPDGTASDIHIIVPVEYGLNEEAIAAVKKWKFKPGTKDGVPVPVYAQVEVSWSLL